MLRVRDAENRINTETKKTKDSQSKRKYPTRVSEVQQNKNWLDKRHDEFYKSLLGFNREGKYAGLPRDEKPIVILSKKYKQSQKVPSAGGTSVNKRDL